MYKVALSHDLLAAGTLESYGIHYAVRSNDVDTIKDLISQGNSVNTGDLDLVKPLHEACFKGYIECVKVLLENGAEVNARNIDGATPLCDAASSGHVDCVKLLIEHGAHVNPPLLLTSPLHEASIRDQWQTVQILVDAGANLNASDCHFGTPLHVTAFQGNKKSADVLLRAGAHVNAIKSHNTPLHDAARRQDFDFIEMLLEYGANPHAQNNSNRKPVDLVPSATSPAKQLLLYWESHVASLRHLCRLRIRTIVSVTRLKHVNNLPLPKCLIDYIEFRR